MINLELERTLDRATPTREDDLAKVICIKNWLRDNHTRMSEEDSKAILAVVSQRHSWMSYLSQSENRPSSLNMAGSVFFYTELNKALAVFPTDKRLCLADLGYFRGAAREVERGNDLDPKVRAYVLKILEKETKTEKEEKTMGESSRKPGETFAIWTYLTNTDLTEGKGKQVPGRDWFLEETDARVEGVNKGPQGTPCLETFLGFGIMGVDGVSYVIGNPGKINFDRPSKAAIEAYRKVLQDKLDRAGVSEGDLACLGYFPRQR